MPDGDGCKWSSQKTAHDTETATETRTGDWEKPVCKLADSCHRSTADVYSKLPIDVSAKKVKEDGAKGQGLWRSKAASIRILVACALCNTLTAVHFSAFSVYYIILTDYYGVTKATAGWVASLGVCMSYCAGVFISPAIGLWTSRWTGAVGGLIVFVGLVASSFATNIVMLIITYGFITGIGIAAAVMCPMVETQQHFAKNRPMAHGVSMIGFSLGSMLSSLLIASLLQAFSLRGAMLVHGAVMLHITPLCFLFRRHRHDPYPPAHHQPASKDGDVVKTAEEGAVPIKAALNAPHKRRSSEITKQLMNELLDFTPLRDILFVFYMLGMTLFRTGLTVFLVNVPSRAVSLGMSISDAALLLSVVSIGQFSTRLPTSILANFISPQARLLVCVGGMMLCSLAGLLAHFATTFALSACLSITFGLGLGLSNTVIATIQSDLFGSARVARLSALTNLCSGVMVIAAPPLAGWMYDVTLDYFLPFMFAGLLSLGGTVSVIAVIPLKARKEKRSLQHDQSAASSQHM